MSSRIIRPTAREVERALAAYRKTHWGRGSRELAVARGVVVDPHAGVLVRLGELTHVSYRTNKDGELDDFVHGFGKRPGEWECHDCGSTDVRLSRDGDGPFPTLAYELDEGRLTLVGGDYRVTWRGIVG